MTTRYGKRLAHRGNRRYMEASRRAGLTPHPWWWHYDAIHARLNPCGLDWYTLKRRAGLPLNEYAPLSAVSARVMMAHLMRGGAYRVTDNGDGSYTHEWTATPRANGEDSQP